MRCKHEWVRVSSRWDGVTPFKPLPGDSVCCCRCGKPKVKGPPVVRADDHELHRRLSYNWLEGVLGREMDSLLEMQIQHDLRDVT